MPSGPSIGKTGPVFDDKAWDDVAKPRRPSFEEEPVPMITKMPRPAVVEEEQRKIYNEWVLEQRDMMAALEHYRKDRGARDTKLDPQGKVRDAVERAHKWLAKEQDKAGHWSWKKGEWNEEYRVGVTGLVLLSFLAEGNCATGGTHKDTVKKGIEYLLTAQDKAGGLFGQERGHWMYNHMVATLAVLENYCLTRDAGYRLACSKAISFIIRTQNKFGGWGYESESPVTDMHVTTWAIMALRMAMNAGLRDLAVVPLMNARNVVGQMLLDNNHYSYQMGKPAEATWQGPTAMGMLAHTMTTFVPDKARLEKQAKELLSQDELIRAKPTTEKPNNLCMLYFMALSFHQMQDSSWDTFWSKVPQVLVQAQDKNTGAWSYGFEHPAFAGQGGQHYVTAIAALILQTYNRYPPIQ